MEAPWGHREQEPNVGLGFSWSILDPWHPRRGPSSSLAPSLIVLEGQGLRPHSQEWPAGAGTRGFCFLAQCSSLRLLPSAEAQSRLA